MPLSIILTKLPDNFGIPHFLLKPFLKNRQVFFADGNDAALIKFTSNRLVCGRDFHVHSKREAHDGLPSAVRADQFLLVYQVYDSHSSPKMCTRSAQKIGERRTVDAGSQSGSRE